MTYHEPDLGLIVDDRRVRVLLLTGMRLRHYAMASRLTQLGYVMAFAERPPVAQAQTPKLAEYFARMSRAEMDVFGGAGFSGLQVIEPGTLSTDPRVREAADAADFIVVFGAPWIKAPLIETLVAKRAVNLHAGVAPEYRGTACNFWALHDGHPELIGFTIHYLSAGLDSGAIIERSPNWTTLHRDPWRNSMEALRVGQGRVVDVLRAWMRFGPPPGEPQDKTREVRYSRAVEFTEEIAAAFLERDQDLRSVGFTGA